jgi:ABC-2 type transport system permease protein
MISFNVFRKEFRLIRRSLVIWTTVGVLVILVYLGFFPYVRDPDMALAIEAYPEALKAAFNINAAVLGDVNLYHGLVMAYVLLLSSIYALMLAGGLVARDADLGTAEFLYTKPVTRRQIMGAKVAAFLAALLVLWVITFSASVVVGLVVGEGRFDLGAQLMVHLSGFLATMAAGGLAFAAAPLINQTQATTSLGAGIGLGSFVVSALSKMSDKLAPLKYLTIQHYAALDSAAAGEPFTGGMAVLAVVFVAATAVGYILVERKQFAG